MEALAKKRAVNALIVSDLVSLIVPSFRWLMFDLELKIAYDSSL
jgi:hypothetical protein